MSTRQKLAVFIFAAIMLFAIGKSSYAEGGWSIQLEPMWMDVTGNDVHVGDVFNYKEEFTEDAEGNYTVKYGVTYDPINLNMDSKLTLRTEIVYKKTQWGLGVSGWWFNTDASLSGRVTTPPSESTGDGYTYYVNGVRMWDSTIIPVYNELEESYCSPVDYWARNDLGVWTANIFGLRTLAEKENSHIDLTFGLKVGSLNNDRNEGQTQRAYVEDYYYYGLDFDNNIRLESTSKADYGLMAGPSIGLQGKAKYKRVGIEALVNQSVLIGKVDQSGTWTDIDDILYTYGGSTIRHNVYTGGFSFSKDETVAIPVTELRLKFMVDLMKNVSIGIGGFASIWYNAPLAPKWSVPGDWTAAEGSGWRLQKNTLVFYGGMAALNIRFN
ncbi:MAG: hypothetical protein COZ68_11105 [Deltaproteobacteria bacterium CG_4_8_14_3_um_filter_43_13]|nr:MAG: hypothetical protein COZ68_11105 [Deltaproteobacteria bacterium CG_4_8_14_3_um_filter_43_13]